VARAGFTNKNAHSKGVAFLKQNEYSFSIGSIPLQETTSLENISLHFDQSVFFQHVNMHS
jgi:HKD family nuclease